MGNSVFGGYPRNRGGAITKLYTSAAWIEGRAELQLEQVAQWPGVKQIAAFPDLHPGKYGPVGCAVLADRVFPQLIGNDIGCGMSLFELDMPRRKLKVEKAARRLRVIGQRSDADYRARLEQIGLSPDTFATALGTIGGGNHFCEVQSLAESGQSGLDEGQLYLLVHSGSRGFGNAVLSAVPQGAFKGMASDDAATRAYQKDHDNAVLWASLNRQIIAERAADALRGDLRLIVDSPHNLLSLTKDGWLHRKGAAKADGALVPLAGSRASPSFLLRPIGNADALASAAHGAGRRYDRSSMHGRVRGKRSDLAAMERTQYGGRVICEDRDLLIEEAALAYKSSKDVVDDLQTTGVAKKLAMFHPLLTFKKTRSEDRT